jgi:hypothetical protein
MATIPSVSKKKIAKARVEKKVKSIKKIVPEINLKGKGVKLVGSPHELINLLVADTQQNHHATRQIVHEGPKHKQVLTALLLKRLFKLVQTIEKTSKTKFSLQKGVQLIMLKDDVEHILPIAFPLNIDTDKDEKKIIKLIAHAPEHEALAYAMCLQVIEWILKTVK